MVRNSFFLLVLGVVLIVPSSAFAQSVSLTSPTVSQNFNAGDDFFSDVLHAPADGSERRMIGWEENFDGPSVGASGGVWHGTNATPGGHVWPLFHSHTGTLVADALPGDTSLPRYGSNYPIDTSKYTYFAYRLRHSQNTSYAVYWTNKDDFPTGTDYGASFGGTYHDVAMPDTGYRLYYFNMADINGSFEQKAGSWSGLVKSLRIDPSISGAAGATTEIDWIRLVDPSSAPNITINWNSSGLSNSHIITVYHDTDGSGYDGTPLKRFSFGSLGFDPQTLTIPSAILPPGQHFFYVEIQQASGGSYSGSPIRTAYSAPVNISQKPKLVITAPSPYSGDSFAATTRNGNEWDMDTGGTDLSNLGAEVNQIFRQFISWSFAASGLAEEGGLFQAMAEPPYKHIGNAESDVQLHMDVPASTPIDPSHYRYVVYRMAIGENGYPSIHDKIEKGWVSRIVAWNTDIVNDGHRTKAHLVYEGFHSYWFDLANPNTIEQGSPWESFFRLPNFRLDPGEFNIDNFYTWFFLDYLKLVGENRTPNNTYDIKYTLSDVDSGSLSVSLYYDTDKSGYDGTLITTLNGQAPGSYTYQWNTSGLPDNTEYYVYVVVNDGVNTTRGYSQVHVKTGAYVPSTPDPSSGLAEFDFDGDGKDDHLVYRPASGQWFLNQSTSGFFSEAWGNSLFKPFVMDIDGDGKADRGVVTVHAGLYLYYVKFSSSGALYSRFWGLPGDKLAIGDYNGDGRDELAVWRPSTGCTYGLYQNDTSFQQCWGLPGDIPVHRDYDGDGKTDMAVWRPSDGMWWVLESSSNFTTYAAKQWGLPGDVPVPGRWGADGKAKYAVWRPSTGTWFIFDAATSQVTAQQWGLPSDKPFARDTNGDGLLDFVVWRPSNGVWYENTRNGATRAVQFGLPIDTVPHKVGDAW